MKFQYQQQPLPYMPRIPELDRLPQQVFSVTVAPNAAWLDAVARGHILLFFYDPATGKVHGNHRYFMKIMRYLDREHKGPAHGMFIQKYRMQLQSLWVRNVPAEYAAECIIAVERGERKRLQNLWNAQMPVVVGGWEIERN